jgi:hypothetical protein
MALLMALQPPAALAVVLPLRSVRAAVYLLP